MVLRPVAEEDARGLASVEAETLRLTGTRRTMTLEELKISYRSRGDHDDQLDLSIIERATQRWIGEVVLNDLDTANGSCGLRILLAAENDYGCRFTIRLVLAHAFDTFGFHLFEREVYDFNPRARRVEEKGWLRARGHQASGVALGRGVGRRASDGDAWR